MPHSAAGYPPIAVPVCNGGSTHDATARVANCDAAPAAVDAFDGCVCAINQSFATARVYSITRLTLNSDVTTTALICVLSARAPSREASSTHRHVITGVCRCVDEWTVMLVVRRSDYSGFARCG